MSFHFLHPPGWAPAVGYANGVAARGRLVFTSGQVGWNPVTGEFETDDLAAQVRQTLLNIRAVLAEAGAEPAHLTRLTWYITDRRAFQAAQREVGAAYREVFGKHFPAMAVVVVAGLLEERARVEIEATAVVPE